MKIAIISHTKHYCKNDGEIVGWGPTIKEINHLSQIADSIVHIAPLHNAIAPKSALAYDSSKITYVKLQPSGGKGIEKLSILFFAPLNLYRMFKVLKKVDYIQFRAPTGIGLYVLPFLRLFFNNKYWVKYAGNWKDNKMPFGNKIQKTWLQKYTSKKTLITINGKWENERANIIPFENPCIDNYERRQGIKILKNKKFGNLKEFCFVGALNDHKGVDKILKAFSSIKNKNIRMHFIGDGIRRKEYEVMAKNTVVEIIFHGFLPKDEICNIYRKCHFILLPSKSEGFPKVIGEAMNYGCVPIVSDVSCISQYVNHEENGFLIHPITSTILFNQLQKAISLSHCSFQKMILKNYKLAEKFTYDYYNNRVVNKVFKIY